MRWVISPIIGDGTGEIVPGQEATTGPYRAKASDYGAHVALIPGNTDGTPKKNWALVYFNGDVTAAEADNALRVIPDYRLDDVLTTIQAAWVNNWVVTNFGDNPGITAGMTVAQAIEALANVIEPGWNLSMPFSVA
jgi:hypothetical protein